MLVGPIKHVSYVGKAGIKVRERYRDTAGHCNEPEPNKNANVAGRLGGWKPLKMAEVLGSFFVASLFAVGFITCCTNIYYIEIRVSILEGAALTHTMDRCDSVPMSWKTTDLSNLHSSLRSGGLSVVQDVFLCSPTTTWRGPRVKRSDTDGSTLQPW